MEEFIDSISLTGILASYGALVSTIAIYLNFKRLRSDKGKLEITGMIAGMIPDPTKKSYLFFNIVNIGKRQIKVKGIAYQETKKGSKQGIIICKNIPCILQEGEEVSETFDTFAAIEDYPYSIYAYDSIGNKFPMNKKTLNRLYSQYRKQILK